MADMESKILETEAEGSTHENKNTENIKSLSGKKNVSDDAREEARGDFSQDADVSIHSPNDDLDEGETARLGEGKKMI